MSHHCVPFIFSLFPVRHCHQSLLSGVLTLHTSSAASTTTTFFMSLQCRLRTTADLLERGGRKGRSESREQKKQTAKHPKHEQCTTEQDKSKRASRSSKEKEERGDSRDHRMSEIGRCQFVCTAGCERGASLSVRTRLHTTIAAWTEYLTPERIFQGFLGFSGFQ